MGMVPLILGVTIMSDELKKAQEEHAAAKEAHDTAHEKLEKAADTAAEEAQKAKDELEGEKE
jgi:hypothetical protein